MFVFWKIWRALFSCNSHFSIRPFALILMNFISNFFLKTRVLQNMQNLNLCKKGTQSLAFLNKPLVFATQHAFL